MSGVRVGTRLDMLIALRSRVAVEIELARRDARRGDVPRPTSGRVPQTADPVPPPAPAQDPPPTPSPFVTVPLYATSPGYMRLWAEAHGFDVGPRGPLHHDVINAFQEAHQ